MILNATERLIELRRIAVLTDLSAGSEKAVQYAASFARWYGSELLIAHGYSPESYPSIPAQIVPTWPASGPPSREDAEKRIESLKQKLNLCDLKPKVLIEEATVGDLLREVDEYRPSLVIVATHGREGIGKWLTGSVAEEVFRKLQRPVMVIGPACPELGMTRQLQLERILYATDLSPVSVAALQYAASIAHDQGAQLVALYVESDPAQGFSFDRAMAQQRLEDWLQDRIDGLSGTLNSAQYVVQFGRPEQMIAETAAQQHANLVVLGARGLGSLSGLASHFLGGTAYEVCCSASSPVMIVPQPH